MEWIKSNSWSKHKMSSEKKTSILKKSGKVFTGLIALVIILVVIGLVLAPDYTRKKTAAGFPINR